MRIHLIYTHKRICEHTNREKSISFRMRERERKQAKKKPKKKRKKRPETGLLGSTQKKREVN